MYLADICGKSPEPQIHQLALMSCVMYVAPEDNVSAGNFF